MTACGTTSGPGAIPGAASSTSATGEAVTANAADLVMIDDLMSALTQVYPPVSTTIQISRTVENALYTAVVSTLANRGYGVQQVTVDQGRHLLSVESTGLQTATNVNAKRLRIGVGLMSISRNYRIDDNDVVLPASGFQVIGSRARIDSAKTMLGAEEGTDNALATTQYSGKALDTTLPTIALITPQVVEGVVESTVGGTNSTSVNSSQIEVNNLFNSESNFQSILDSYDKQVRRVIIFPNDSMVLGDENKLLIRGFLDDYIEGDDVVSVIGCSNGATDLAIGNVGLALGRAARVTDELTALGVPRDKIYDEGCWANSHTEDYPGRGVVMELWRAQL